MTIASRVGTLITTAILAFGIAMPAKANLIKELIPTGKLRVAIAVAPAPSALYAVKDSTAGKFRGVTVDLGAALARKLGAPVRIPPAPCVRRDPEFGGEWKMGRDLYAGRRGA